MGFEGAMGVIGVAVGFVILYWMIRQLDRDGSLREMFTPPKSGQVSDWIGWLLVVGFLLIVFYQMVNFILTGENGCEPGENVDRWGNCV